jgi:hypothetical protein
LRGFEIRREDAVEPRLAGRKILGFFLGHDVGAARRRRAFGEVIDDLERAARKFRADRSGGVARTLHRTHIKRTRLRQLATQARAREPRLRDADRRQRRPDLLVDRGIGCVVAVAHEHDVVQGRRGR